MAKLNKTNRTGFVIKLSCETVQKLTEEEQTGSSSLSEKTDETTNKIEASSVTTSTSDVNKIATPAATPLETIGTVEITSTNQKQEPLLPSATNEKTVTNQKQEPSVENTDSATSWGDYAPYITYDGDQAVYTDPSTQLKYTWNNEKSSWDPIAANSDVPGREYSYENDTHVYTDSDGSKFFWDVERKAWIPKVDDDFMAFYQMSYGFVDNMPKEEKKDEEKKKENQNKAETGVKRKTDPQWFEQSEDKNTKVYVSNLPQDMTEEEFVNHMQKCGLVERDPVTQKMKVKLYMDKEHNCFKGDALCTYIKIESVDLALKLLDGSDFKGNKITVERAHFQLKGDYNPALKPKKKKKKELEKLKKMQQKLFDWRPEKFIGERSKHERIVIIKNLFHPSDFDNEVQLILDYQQDLREECGKCGEVRKVVIYDRHPEGVAQVTMKEPEQADAVVQLISGRWFGKRQITAEIWDGRTKYRIAETDADIGKRIDKWDKFLEGKDGEGKCSTTVEKSNAIESGTDVGNETAKINETK